MEKELKIITINKKDEKKILRNKTAAFDFSKFTQKEINDLVKAMRMTMIGANGIGLAANQIGLNMRVFVAQIPKIKYQSQSITRTDTKFYSIFNPEIIKTSESKNILDEGCLSVPDIYGDVARFDKVTLIGFDKNGRKIKIKAAGLLARVFQHEVDHLNGILYFDKSKKLYKVGQK